MSDFESELQAELKDEFGATTREAKQIAEMAAQFKNETDSEITRSELIEEMDKLPDENPVSKWNTVVSRLNLPSWGDSTESNPYQIDPMNEKKLKQLLDEEFNPDPIDLEAVVRQAMRLDQSGEFEEAFDNEVTEERIVNAIKQADRSLAASWNWWLGSLDYLEGGFRRFQV